MGIFGVFRVELPRECLRNMKPGTAGYIFSTNFVMSKSRLCIPLDTEVFYKIEDIIEANRDNYVAVYKLEDGLSPECFDIDLEEDQNFDTRNWYLTPSTITEQYAKSKDWICFPNPPIFFDEVSFEEDSYADVRDIHVDLENIEQVLGSVIISNLSITELQTKLEQAVFKEDYETAVKIRDELKRKRGA